MIILKYLSFSRNLGDIIRYMKPTPFSYYNLATQSSEKGPTNQDDTRIVSEILITVDRIEYLCRICYLNNQLSIEPSPPDELSEKIRFAFVHADSKWTGTVAAESNIDSGILTSSIANMRSR